MFERSNISKFVYCRPNSKTAKSTGYSWSSIAKGKILSELFFKDLERAVTQFYKSFLLSSTIESLVSAGIDVSKWLPQSSSITASSSVGLLSKLKRLAGGGVTVAELVPESWMAVKGLKGVLLRWFFTWGDNFLYTFVMGENTVALFYSLVLSAQRGEWIGFIGSPGGPTI